MSVTRERLFSIMLIALMGCTRPVATEDPVPRLPRRQFTGSARAMDRPPLPGKETGTLVPGQSVGMLELGMTRKEVQALIGVSGTHRTFSQEHTNYKSMGYTPEDELVFFAGFDESLQFDTQNKKHLIPLYKAFFKNDRLVYAILTTYAGFKVSGQTFTVEGLPAFHAKGRPILQHLGPYHFRPARGYDGEYYFLDRGVEFTLENGKVTVIDLFSPLSPTQADQYRRRTASGAKDPNI